MPTTSAVITGGASGLGEACARQFAKQGITVWILDQNGDRASSVADNIAAEGGVAHAAAIDVTDRNALDQLATRIHAETGAPDILVTAAGIIESVSTILDADMDAHDRLWAINYGGTVNACRSFGRLMRDNGSGAIVTIGSVNSYCALPLPAYCPSKTAILRLTEMLAVELGRHNIRVNGIAPTYVLTPGLQAKVDAGERNLDTIRNTSALNKIVTTQNIADVVSFLISDAAAAVTGHMMPVDAGYIAVSTYTGFAGGTPWDQ
jgi:NAD(P)-dependent dehydrogenase (short-subunit alcohol dehydrogenase family)